MHLLILSSGTYCNGSDKKRTAWKDSMCDTIGSSSTFLSLKASLSTFHLDLNSSPLTNPQKTSLSLLSPTPPPPNIFRTAQQASESADTKSSCCPYLPAAYCSRPARV